MGLIDRLAASGAQPRKTSAADFFRTHPGLLDEVKEAASRFSYLQINRLLTDEYGWQLDIETLRRYVGQK